MGSENEPKGTASPARNFTLTVDERIRAMAAGPPAYARRKRLIEDLEDAMLRRLREAEAKGSEPRRVAEAMSFDRINDLIARHNRYYPVEANLPMHPRTGALLERGAPWCPLPPITVESLLARLAEREGEEES